MSAVENSTRPESKLMIPTKLLRSVGFLDWAGTAEFKTWVYLISSVIRAPMGDDSFGRFIHDNYYVHGVLIARWNLKQLAENMGKSRGSAGQISRHTTEMANKNFVKKEYCAWNNQKTLIYIMGTHDKSTNKNEVVFAFEELWEKEKQRKKDKKEESPQEVFDKLELRP